MSKLITGKVELKCEGNDMFPLDDIKPLQGELKTLHVDQYEKIKKSMLKYGFSFPVFVWRDFEGIIWTIDGHQRVFTLKRMMSEGYNVPMAVPVVYIQAVDKDEAKEKVLLASSRYGVIEREGLAEFLHSFDENVNFDDLKEVVDIPEFSMDEFDEGFVKDVEIDEKETTAPTHVSITLEVHNEDYASFLNQLQEVVKKFPRVSYKQEKLGFDA
jgi:hypothetical protein